MTSFLKATSFSVQHFKFFENKEGQLSVNNKNKQHIPKVPNVILLQLVQKNHLEEIVEVSLRKNCHEIALKRNYSTKVDDDN